MRKWLHILVLLLVHQAYGQCPNSRSDNDYMDNSSETPKVIINGPYVSPRDHKSFIFGMGWHHGVMTNNLDKLIRGPRAEESEDTWKHNVSSFYLDLAFPLAPERHIAFGINMTFGTLFKQTKGQISSPSDYEIEYYNYLGELNPVRWDTRLRLRQHSYLAFFELELWRKNDFSIVSRSEFGITRYPFLTQISIESNDPKPLDSECPERKAPFQYLTGSSSNGFTGGFSLGVSLAQGGIDFRASIGYRIHHMRNVPSIASASGTSSALNSSHNYANPASIGSFYSTKPNDFTTQNTWNGLLTIQVGINFRFGNRWYD